jgi:hypothetical protein
MHLSSPTLFGLSFVLLDCGIQALTLQNQAIGSVEVRPCTTSSCYDPATPDRYILENAKGIVKKDNGENGTSPGIHSYLPDYPCHGVQRDHPFELPNNKEKYFGPDVNTGRYLTLFRDK